MLPLLTWNFVHMCTPSNYQLWRILHKYNQKPRITINWAWRSLSILSHWVLLYWVYFPRVKKYFHCLSQNSRACRFKFTCQKHPLYSAIKQHCTTFNLCKSLLSMLHFRNFEVPKTCPLSNLIKVNENGSCECKVEILKVYLINFLYPFFLSFVGYFKEKKDLKEDFTRMNFNSHFF